MALEELRRIRKEKYTAAGGSVPYNAGFAPGNIYQEVKQYAEEVTPDSYTPQQIAQGFGNEQAQIVEEVQIPQQAPAVQKSTESPEYQKAKQQLIDLQKQQQQQSVLSRNEVLKQGTGIKDYANGFFNNIVNAAKNLFGMNDQPSLSDQMMANEAFRQTYWRQERAIENYADLVLQDKVSDKQNYTPADSFIGRAVEGAQNISPTVIYGVLQPAIGNVARQIGDKTGNQELTYWGEKYGLQTAINFANSKAGQSVASIPSFSQGGYKDPAYYTNAVAQTIGTYGATIGAGITGYLLSGGNPTVAGYAALSAGFAQESSQMYVGLVDSGTATNKAMDASLLYGAAATYMENSMGFKPTSAISSLFKNGLKKVSINLASKPLYKTALKLAIEEGEEELLQQLTQNAITKTLNEDQSLTEGLLDSFVQGGLGGALLGGGANVTTKITNKMTNFASKLYNSKSTQATTIKDVQKSYNDYVNISDKVKENPTDQDIKQLNIVKEQLLNNSQQFAQPAVDLSVISENTSVKSSIIPLGDKYSYNININLGDVSLRENGVETKQVFNTREEASKQLVNRLKQIINTNTVPAMSKVVIEKRIAEYQEAGKYADMISPDYIETTTKDLNKQLKGISNFNQSVAEINRTYRAILDKFDTRINQAFTQKYFKDNANLKTPKQREKYDQVNNIIKEKRVQFEQAAKESFDKLANRAVKYAAKRGYNLSEDQTVSFKSSFMELLAAKKSIDQFGNKGIKELVKTLMNLRQDDFNSTQKKKIDRIYEGEKLKKIELVSDFDSSNPNDPKTQMAQYQYEILQAMEIGEGGYKQFDDYGEFVEGVKSSVPDWIPEEYRSTKVIKSVVDHINKGTIPTKVKEIGLYKEVADLFDQEKISLNLQELTEELPPAYVYDDLIKKEKEYDEKINREIEEINNEEVSSQVTTGKEQKDVKTQTAIDYLSSKREMFRLATDLDNQQLTTKILKLLGDRETVSKQFVTDLTNKGEIKQVEKDIIRKLLDSEQDKINVKEFKDKVVAELLPLTIIKGGESTGINNNFPLEKRYENITLAGDIRGDVKNYDEHLYQSPIATSAGDIHFNGDSPNYFGHTRIEDMADDTTRRVIEVQSDLYQRGRLEMEDLNQTNPTIEEREARKKELQKLYQYNNPTYSFRLIREELAQASRDGKTKLLLPTGETAMKIEGLGGTKEEFSNWQDGPIEGNDENGDLRDMLPHWMEKAIGKTVNDGNDDWVITDVIGQGKFKAVPKRVTHAGKEWNFNEMPKDYQKSVLQTNQETFDISGEVDTSNPIYKFYEKEVAKYVKNNYKAQTITDENGVTWNQINVTPEMAGAVEAFRTGDTIERKTGIKITDQQRTDIERLNKELFGDTNVNFIERLLTPTGQEALGVYRDKMINIVDGKADAKDTFYHEAVHRYMDIFGDMTERAEVLEEVKTKNNLESYNEAEEVLAENFINYARSREGFVGKIKQFFDSILNKVKVLLNKQSTDKITALYNDILAGKGKLKERGFSKNVAKSDVAEALTKRNIKSFYLVKPNPETMAMAKQAIQDDPQKSFDRVMSDEMGAEVQAIGQLLGVEFQKMGRLEDAHRILERVMEKGTVSGQSSQIMSMWSKLSPENIGNYVSKIFTQYNDEKKFTGSKKVKLSPEELSMLVKQAEKMESLIDDVNEFGIPEKYFLEKKKLDKWINSKTPNNQWHVFSGTIGRGMMLASVKSPVTNIIGNTVQGLLQSFEKRLARVQFSGLNSDMALRYVKMVHRVYQKTGTDVTRITSLESGTKTLGEKTSHSEGKGFLRAWGRVTEDYIFKQLMGVPDVVSASIAFIDTANLLSSHIATRQEKLTGIKAKQRARAMMLDSIKIIPETKEGAYIREQAILDAQLATFTNKGKIAAVGLNIREAINKAGGEIKAGDMIMPFVKTPANMGQMALETAGFGLPIGAYELYKAKKDVLSGDKKAAHMAIRQMIRAGLGITLAFAIGSAFDDDDILLGYPEKWSAEEKLLYLRGGSRYYHMVRIGDKWVSTDYFGVLQGPLLGLLYAKKYGDNWPNKALFYLLGQKEIFRQVPVIEELGELSENLRKAVTKKDSFDKILLDLLDGAVDWTASRVIPGIVSDIAKMTDEYDRWTDGTSWGRIQKRIPGLRKRLELMTDQFGNEIKTPDPLWSLFAGGRLKNDLSNKITDEYYKLLKDDSMPSLSDVEDWTRFEQAKTQLGEEKYKEAFKHFQLEWKNRTIQMIDDKEYNKLQPEDKKKELDDMRSDVADEVLEKYGYKYEDTKKKKTGGPVFKKTTGSSGPVFKK